jgi:hypothetical protein
VEGFGSVGSKVADSRRPNSSAFSFGSSGRESYGKTYVDKRTDRSGGRPNMTTSSVQFHNIDNMHSVGPTRSQIIAKTPVFSFGKCTREQGSKAYLKGVSDNCEYNSKAQPPTCAHVFVFAPIGSPCASNKTCMCRFGLCRFG